MKYSFQIQWPAPFAPDWKKSGRSFASIEEAANALADFMAITYENGVQIAGRICPDNGDKP